MESVGAKAPRSRFLPRLEILEARAQEDVVLFLRVVELVALAPVVRHRVREDLAVLVERALRDRLLARLRRLQLRALVLVPEREAAVRPDRRQRAVHRVKSDVVHRKNVLEAVDGSGASVALEGEVVLG